MVKTANARRAHGRHAEAERLYQRALHVAEATFGERHHEVAAILTSMAALLLAQGRTREAESLKRRAERIADERSP